MTYREEGIFDEVEFREALFEALVDRGYVPSEEECRVIAEFTTDYLINCGHPDLTEEG